MYFSSLSNSLIPSKTSPPLFSSSSTHPFAARARILLTIFKTFFFLIPSQFTKGTCRLITSFSTTPHPPYLILYLTIHPLIWPVKGYWPIENEINIFVEIRRNHYIRNISAAVVIECMKNTPLQYTIFQEGLRIII